MALVSFYMPLEISENLWFLDVFREYEMGKNVLKEKLD